MPPIPLRARYAATEPAFVGVEYLSFAAFVSISVVFRRVLAVRFGALRARLTL